MLPEFIRLCFAEKKSPNAEELITVRDANTASAERKTTPNSHPVYYIREISSEDQFVEKESDTTSMAEHPDGEGNSRVPGCQ